MKNSISARSPLSPTLWPKDAFPWWASLGLALLVFLVSNLVAFIVVVAFAAASPGSIRLNPAHPALTWPLVIAQLISNAGTVAVLVLVLPAVAKRSLAELGLHAPRLRDVVWGIGGAIAMEAVTIAVAALQQSIFHLKPDEVQVQYLRNMQGSVLGGMAFAACIAAPITEELTFRGFVFNAFRRYMPTGVAVVLSALLFGAAHWLPGNGGVIAPLAAGGIVLAAIYYRSGSLVASMIAHGLFNSFTVIAVVVFHQNG